MAVGLPAQPEVKPVAGFRLGSTAAGIKYSNRKDLTVISWSEQATVAGVFTQNRFCAAPVLLAKQRLFESGKTPRCFVINTGYANAGTGQQGMNDAMTCCERVAEIMGCDPEQVLPFSTGVIGEPLPVDRICAGLPAAVADLSEDSWCRAAEAIMTTDTVPKGYTVPFMYQGQEHHLSGICKGAGMIRPNMATMLAYVATDLSVPQNVLQQALQISAEKSFNRVTVDGDTSTNDACMLVATGASESEPLMKLESADGSSFQQALTTLLQYLAQALIRDGEGATKFVSIQVEQAASSSEALEVAYTVAHSPLVKTALYASDPNWGRILAAVGRADVENLDINRLRIWLDDVCIVEWGGCAPGYEESRGQAVMDQQEIVIRIELGSGSVSETVWTSDLSHDYVKINAEYRT
ncbi:bifunctional glutamate N-acetyltransferase/amino-acid acetyltransferase ArgJ [Endozoicomonadaceae bacterium StTr2]